MDCNNYLRFVVVRFVYGAFLISFFILIDFLCVLFYNFFVGSTCAHTEEKCLPYVVRTLDARLLLLLLLLQSAYRKTFRLFVVLLRRCKLVNVMALSFVALTTQRSASNI